MRKAFVHIGMPKTGTTAVQKAMSNRRVALLHGGLLYPGDNVDHAFLVQNFHPARGRHFYFKHQKIEPNKAEKIFRKSFHKLEREVAQSDGDVLISTEYLYNMGEERLRALRTGLSEMGLDLHVVCYVRHPIGQATSGIQQNVKMGHDTLANQLRNPQWHSCIETLAPALRALGRSKVIVTPFEFAKELGTERHILKAIGHKNLMDLVERAEANVGLSGAAVILADAHNRLLRKYPQFPASRGYLFRIGGFRFTLPPWTIAKMKDRVQQEVKWLDEHFSLTLPEPESQPFRHQRLSEDAAEDVVKIIVQSDR